MALVRLDRNRLISLAFMPLASVTTFPIPQELSSWENWRPADTHSFAPIRAMEDKAPKDGMQNTILGSFTLDKARLVNRSIPFSPSLGKPAAPLHLSGDAESQARAIDCLASAMWYEAGGDVQGQRAVGQVVMNRVRHVMFPKSVCGVVFQGSERKTGCQFTFTCDGAMGRVPSPAAFARARAEARRMLEGTIDPAVGAATHYHTDWVHPVWSGAMQKIAKIDTHLFFRWPGSMGKESRLSGAYSGDEPAIAKLAALSPAHRKGFSPEQLASLAAFNDPALSNAPSAQVELVAVQPPPAALAVTPPVVRAGVFDLTVNQTSGAAAPAKAALNLCGERQFCKVVGRALVGTSANNVVFLYVRDRRTGVDQVLWDCQVFPRQAQAQCLANASRNWLAFEGSFASAKP